jgi:beta-glucoside operon transcriptional antiterminator
LKIHKVINNNVVSVINNQNQELVVMGRGLAFKKKSGDPIDEKLIEKVFKLDNKDLNEKFKSLINEIPLEYMEVADQIIKFAEKVLGKKLNESIYVSLTDHIHFAIQRHQKGMDIKNALLWDIKRLYKEEFIIGTEALKLIKEKVDIDLPEDEAGFIALHVVNAELNDEMPTILNITKFIQEILTIVKYHFKIEFDEESLNYFRFVTHLKFFAQRMLNKTYLSNDDDLLYNMVIAKYKDSVECVEKIKEFVAKKYEYEISKEEFVYLTIHITRVVNRS